MSLVERLRRGDRLALSRLLTAIEDGDPTGEESLIELYPHTGKAHIVGVTGSTGTGKSTLVNQLTRFVRQDGRSPLAENGTPSVAIVAVDPTSPFSGGAILGDRIRMQDLAGDPEVFIRSMASRGALGGLSRRTGPVVDALDAAGFHLILVETVGAGQAEVEVARAAHTTIVVDAPGLGDGVQAIKAGILEIADILVLNKADRSGARRAAATLRAALRYDSGEAGDQGWSVPLLETVATEGEGIPQVAEAVAEHGQFLRESSGFERRRRSRIESQLSELLAERLKSRYLQDQRNDRYQDLVDRVVARELAPQQAIEELLQEAR